ncbi:MAG: sorbosone dehydrogenase [Bacteroidetes bacterium]|jgi:glucose/arabinose dehydrogenase|nr:sorbosone dehydrogenase [Bacteroidota bacterium]
MLRKTTYFLILILLTLVVACSSGDESAAVYENMNFSPDNGGITLPDGFQAVVVADSIGSARQMTVDEDGDIYVALSNDHNGNGIAALRDTDGDGVADTTAYFGDYTGTGIALHNGYLYFAPDTAIVRYSMDGLDLVPTAEPEMVVTGFPDQGSHAAKPITFDGQGNLYVNIGAPSNACQEESRTPGSPGMDPCPQLEWQGSAWQFNANTTGQTLQEDGYKYATGYRHAVALDFNSEVENLFLVQHGRDQLNTLWPEYYDSLDNAELPAEEFFKVDDGDNFGWPFTYYDQRRGEKMISPEYGGDGETPYTGDDFEDPIQAFPGHWAPNDLIFYHGDQFPQEYYGGAFIAFHGSWNRAPLPQAGYRVTFTPFNGTEVAGDYQTFANGFAGEGVIRSPGQAEHRPMGLAEGPDGSVYIVDSRVGKIWRVFYTGSQ